ncbi:MAG: PhzF family phenazine biosynthesis protein [Gammaproteobacteria bacterium]|jgi:trans-2,3-dihydro-3-hydroxyanthranilate isomerase|nr:PhzF family phenazine biosynthesis protein [Gammaproteobacteria bacterium]MBT5223371.1 PhzF family phenazine biosynthesis protein [Gammaproteobacteria bacterium]MBT5825355.1 PhzF family phenazine biosynthesis protein [Gammaproteobacteria bacterium]MBT6420047.1 PhzF family phenazine biosynthesis protein [Gammaproteobacteria bacterium]MBT6576153.1 PhzF family phenazine biosynthesis protein [Gammaproteobacteria bacterium]
MTLSYYIADVFTNQIFAGAQIAVFPNSGSLSDDQMAAIAREINLSETVFVSNPSGEALSRTMRIFSPLGEIDFAGHPIIATAFVLGESDDIALTDGVTALTFTQNIGEINVNVSASAGKVNFVQFSRKVSSIIDRFTPTIAEIAEQLSISPDEIDHKKYSTRLVSCGFPYLIVPVWNYETVRNAKFNFASWSMSAAPQTAAQEILLFSPKTPFKDANFNARLLGPNISVNDDPPVGSAMPAFASYLCSFDFTQQGTHTFTVDRGDDKNRRSVLNIEMDHKAQSGLALRIGGEAVMVAEGKMHIPA